MRKTLTDTALNLRASPWQQKTLSHLGCVLVWMLWLLISQSVYGQDEDMLATRQAPDLELKELLMKTVNEADSFVDRFDAEVWLVDMSKRLSRYIKDPEERLTLLRKVHAEARKAKLEPELVMALIHVESAFERYAISSVGAQGLMQVMPFWKNEIGRPDDNLMDIQTNLRYGCTILKHYINKEKGNLIRALARYNGSLGRLKYPEKVMRFWELYWFIKHV